MAITHQEIWQSVSVKGYFIGKHFAEWNTAATKFQTTVPLRTDAIMDKPSTLQRYRLIGKLSALPEAQEL